VKDHRALTPRQEARAQRALFGAILTLRNVDECRAFFQDLCTPAELQALTDRWAVVGLLQEGVPYREIHKLTGVSVTTIGRVARSLSIGSGGYQLVTEHLAAERTGADRPSFTPGKSQPASQAGRDEPEDGRSAARPSADPTTDGRTKTRRSGKSSPGRSSAGHAHPHRV